MPKGHAGGRPYNLCNFSRKIEVERLPVRPLSTEDVKAESEPLGFSLFDLDRPKTMRDPKS